MCCVVCTKGPMGKETVLVLSFSLQVAKDTRNISTRKTLLNSQKIENCVKVTTHVYIENVTIDKLSFTFC